MLKLNLLQIINNHMNKVLLSLGSNLDSRKYNIQNCIDSLSNSKNINIIAISSLYESSPMYNSNQEDFINCVIEIETSLKPLELLKYNQLVEKDMGRSLKFVRNQPRKIDIDILIYNNEIVNEENLEVPHPRISERKFVLIPLFELKGNIAIPGHAEKIEDLIKKLDKNSDKISKCNYRINEENLSYSS